MRRTRPPTRFACLALLLGAIGNAPLAAQGTSDPTVSDSKVGYIDNAIPGNVLRFGFDSAYNFQRPTRAEFFYAQSAPGGPGLPRPEPRIDYQEASLYAEYAVAPGFSVFAEEPFRMLNPQVNADHSGFGDINAGWKYAFLRTEETVATFQFRTFAPTGDANEGLGTRHVSLEPALLLYQKVEERLALAGELRYWVPVGGTDFAGDILRYGAGVQYDIYRDETWRATPVLEMVGWTVLGGKEAAVLPSGKPTVQGASGDTIVNLKLGMRVGVVNRFDVYAGYGFPVTGDGWYQDIFRLQLRFLY